MVITDKLPETDISAGSAAEMLVIPNVYARRYANYLLNGIHLCGSLEELHEYPDVYKRQTMCVLSHPAVAVMSGELCFPCMGASLAAFCVFLYFIIRQRRGE